jgi:hypothetical protein
MRPVVVFTTNDRPHYLAQTLESWSHVRGIGDALLIFSCEPSFALDEIRALLGVIPFAETQVYVNQRPLGVEANPYKAELLGFETTDTDFVIQAEDDATVTTDFLEYMTWARDTYRDDPTVHAVCSYQNTQRGPVDEVFRRQWFCAKPWGTWRDRWDGMRDYWPSGPLPGVGSWDAWMTEHVLKRHGTVVIEPCQSRSKNIGVTGYHGSYPEHTAAEWERQQFMPDIPPQSYREVPA